MTETQPPGTDIDPDACTGAWLHGLATVSFTIATLGFWWRTLPLPVVPQAQASLMMLLHIGSIATAWLAHRHATTCIQQHTGPESLTSPHLVGPVVLLCACAHVALVAGGLIH